MTQCAAVFLSQDDLPEYGRETPVSLQRGDFNRHSNDRIGKLTIHSYRWYMYIWSNSNPLLLNFESTIFNNGFIFQSASSYFRDPNCIDFESMVCLVYDFLKQSRNPPP